MITFRRLEVIYTDRSTNTAYVAYGQDKPYLAFNATVKLNWIEEVGRCKFDDGDHPFVTVFVGEREIPYVHV